ncbi:tetratricopeptide repeat protein [Myceligenerans pegani]|uniref:Tetratricopeptide repeat protein n=1 Tax=Myceligenerans pegani TaxID=2776917 RepID=A0ABR9MT09_9MICO|nr:tetratricopeptide repeat protein [Myceligenerans sp. TRM 65318]MBE1874512.1 tetratricopeptide repeat protein [Myceligenerans sp. TRM 65318]MBE3016783.1 tetratricopeptide repeat protein [Myceligenerans sp. TRM 65318]
MIERTRTAWRRIANAGSVRGGPSDGLAHLLDPARRVVPYSGRDADLAELLAWCREPHAVQLRLTTGLGGVGKTRLAVEAARRLTRSAWRCVWIRPSDDDAAVRAALSSGTRPTRRTLVIVDDAASRTDLAALLARLRRTASGKLRVLLLSRTGREWWYRLRWASDLWAGDVRTSVTHLAPPHDQDEQALVTAAAQAFARGLGTSAPALTVRRSADRPSPLDLHAAALVAVADGGPAVPSPGEPPVLVDPSRALGALLDRERGRWTVEAARAGLPTDDVEDAVAAAMLLGAGSDGTAREALRRTAPVLATDAGVAWLRGLAGPAGDIDSAIPRRMAEQHVARRLAATPWLADGWIRGLPAAVAHRAAVLLCSAQIDPPPGPGRAPIDAVLGRVVDELPPDPAVLGGLLGLLPQHPAPPGGLMEALTARILDLDGTPAAWADALTHRTRALCALGRHQEALQPAAEAVAAWRVVAAEDPDRYGRCLARSLCGLGTVRDSLGRHAEAHAALTEALAVLRTSPPHEAVWNEPELALVLRAVSATYASLGRYAESDAAALEEVAVLRRLVQRDPVQYEAQLAWALIGGGPAVDRGRPTETLEALTEGLDLWRRLARRYAVDFEPQLAFALSLRSCALAELGRLEEAVAAETEALEMRRHLAAAEPERYDGELALSLARLGAHLSGLGRVQHAYALETEALAARRRLARQNPRAYAYTLASSLSNLGVTCSRLGRFTEALPLEQEAVAIRRDLAAEAPERFDRYLARSLSNLGVRYSDLGEPERAVEPTREAVEILRRLSADEPDRHRPDLASACANLGATYADLGRVAEAAELLRESVTLLRDLASRYPARFRPELARACSTCASLLVTLGRPEEAVEHATEAVAIRHALVAMHGTRYREDLDLSLAILSEACDPRGAPPTSVRSR